MLQGLARRIQMIRPFCVGGENELASMATLRDMSDVHGYHTS